MALWRSSKCTLAMEEVTREDQEQHECQEQLKDLLQVRVKGSSTSSCACQDRLSDVLCNTACVGGELHCNTACAVVQRTAATPIWCSNCASLLHLHYASSMFSLCLQPKSFPVQVTICYDLNCSSTVAAAEPHVRVLNSGDEGITSADSTSLVVRWPSELQVFIKDALLITCITSGSPMLPHPWTAAQLLYDMKPHMRVGCAVCC